MPLGESNVRVSIQAVYSPEESLPVPVPNAEMITIMDAHKSLVAWPKKFVIQEDEVSKVSEELDDTSMSEFHVLLDAMEVDAVNIPLDIFGDNCTSTYLPKLEMRRFSKMQKLDVSCIYVYMRLLSETCSKSREVVQFINPNSFGEALSKNYLNRYILDRFTDVKEGHVYFAPLNTGDHWVLVVIDYSTMTVFWLDSAHRKPSTDFKFKLDTALKALVVIGRRKPPPSSDIIKGPKQPFGSIVCGYFMLKFMRDLMQNPSKSIKEKMRNIEGRPTYDDSELLEVQHEFISFIKKYIKGI